MDTKLKGLWEKVKDFFKNMSKKMRIILGAGLAVIVVAAVILAVVLNNKPYTVLYQDLTPAEASEIMSYFQNNGITDYQVTSANTILVRNDQYNALLAQLALAGYPKDGTLYGNYFDRVGALSTSSQEARAWQVSTQEKLETSIRSFPGVLDVQVYISPGEDRTYVLQDVTTQTTATVKLDLRSGYTLSDEQADAIRLLVSHAWSGMTIDDVAVLDTLGNTYTGGNASASDAAELKRALEQSEANRIRREVMQALTPLYGENDVRVSVGVVVDVNKRYVESTTYHQPDGSYESGGLIGSELGYYALTRDGLQAVGGVPGTESNADIPTYMEDLIQGAGDEDSVIGSWEKDNKIDSTLEQTEIIAPTVVSASIAVTINENANSAANVNVEELMRHVARAAGLSVENPEEWVSVLVAPFREDTVESVDNGWFGGLIPASAVPYVIIIAAALLLILIVVIVLLSVRRKKKQKQAEEDQRLIEEQLGQLSQMGGLEGVADLGGLTPEMAAEVAAGVPPAGGADIMEINTEKSMELRKSVRQFVQNNPELAAQMLKVWLKGDEDDG